jgi:ribosome-binding protein aMBF1 (putative translation factor)
MDSLNYFPAWGRICPTGRTSIAGMKKKCLPKSSRSSRAGARSELEPVCRALPALVRERRQQLGLSLNELARRSQLSRQAVALVERAQRVPGLDTLSRLGHALESTSWQLLRAAERRARRQRRVS